MNPLVPAGNTIGERIVYVRKLRNLSRVQLAVAAGVHPNTIQRIESGGRKPTMDTLLRIASVLDAPVSQLLPQPVASS